MKIGAAALCLLSCLATAAVAAEPDWKVAVDSVERVVAGRPGGFFYKRGSLFEHIFAGMSVPDNGRRPSALPDGNYMFSGCRRHFCPEKSAIVASPSGEMLAAGLMHFPGCQDKDPITVCVGVPPVVTIFLRRSHKDERLAQHLRDWAKREEPKVTSFETKLLAN